MDTNMTNESLPQGLMDMLSDKAYRVVTGRKRPNPPTLIDTINVQVNNALANGLRQALAAKKGKTPPQDRKTSPKGIH